ncbi:Tn3 family transposase [Francisella sp. SYW-2]|uniref:Tn3 family transposase n=1 Tax=Francisella sp. SYW-2 TaxID=2610886 RepID=UPI00123CF7C8|nr:Tn3 family transposase [Francisella sp. SYW-2]
MSELFTQQEIELIKKRHHKNRLAFGVILYHYKTSNELIINITEIQQYPKFREISQFIECYKIPEDLPSKTIDNFCSTIRSFFKSSYSKKSHYDELAKFLSKFVLPIKELNNSELQAIAKEYLKDKKIDSFKDKILQRVIKDAINDYEKSLFENINNELSDEQKANFNGLLLTYKYDLTYLGWINKDITNPSLESILTLIEILNLTNKVNIKVSSIVNLPRKRLEKYAESFTRFSPSDLKVMKDKQRIAHLAIYTYIRRQQIIDRIIDMFSKISKNIIHRSERRMVKKLISQIKKVYGKDTILFNIAEACLDNPDDTIRNKIFPIVGENKLNSIILEYKKKGPKYQNILHEQIRSSYARYYRRMIQPLLSSIILKSNNTNHQPIIEAVELIKKYFNSSKAYFPKDIEVPINFLPKKCQARIIDNNGNIKRICYEVYVLKKLADRIRCREIWVEGSFLHRNPDYDLPKDFDASNPENYDNLSLPFDPEEFIKQLKENLSKTLEELNNNIKYNRKVRIDDNRIVLSPLEPQKESQNITYIKKLLQDKWLATNLIDQFKEASFRTKFTKSFISYGSKVYLQPTQIAERILLVIYGFGTNVGLKHVRAGSPHINYKQLEHIKDYFVSKDNIKDAICIVANALLNQRSKTLWGEMPVAVAGDSTQFTAYFQNLISEYHNRYGGRGVMIYWHVEKNACCINSQLKSVSNSEVSSMIEGVLRHCTEMSVEKNYVDTHGQSEVGFAFSHLLGFNLMPRLANLSKQKLSRCEIADYNKYSNIQDIMTDTINWDLIKEQYSEMVKYTIAMKENYADPEAILRRFNRNNLKHPTYLALSQLGKVIKTIFICKYLMDEKIRQEIHEGLNVVELWNGVSKFIFYGRSGEISSNRQKNQEISVLSLHLLQLNMVYINTLMIQQIIKENNLMDKLTKEDKRAITPLIYEHVNPYGLFPLDMNERLPDLDYQEAA